MAGGSNSSFQRKVGGSALGSIPGVSPSLYSPALTTSTGVPHLDTLLGGGLNIGSLLLLLEDQQASYSSLCLRYFLAQGHSHGHSLVVAQDGPRDLLSALPSLETKEEARQKEPQTEDQMKIAWRYQAQSNTKAPAASSTGQTFNLLKTVPKEEINQGDVTNLQLSELQGEGEGESWGDSTYSNLISKIQSKLSSGGFLLEPGKVPKNVVRLGLSSIGSLGWGTRKYTKDHLSTLLLSLRALLRSSTGVCVLTLPHHLHTLPDLRDRLVLCSDYVVELDSFSGRLETVGPAYRDYHGLVRVHKVAALGALSPPLHLSRGETGELVFKSRRNQFVIERFSLPPDLGEKVSRDNKASTTKRDIDF